MERLHGTIKSEFIRSMPIINFDQMKSEIGEWIEFYNNERLHSAIQYVAPMDIINGRNIHILLNRKRKIIDVKQKRKEYYMSVVE